MVRFTKPDDLQKLSALWKDIFGDSEEFVSWLFSRRFMPEYCVCYEENGEIISCMHGYPMKVNVSGKAIDAVTISGVATLPKYRNKGIMKKMFHFFMDDMHQKKIPLVFYTPKNALVYSFSGHGFVTRALKVNKGEVKCNSSIYRVKELAVAEHIPLLKECYEASSSKYSGMILRGDYYDIKMHEYIADNLKCIAAFSGESVQSYIIFGRDNSSLSHCEECIGSPDALAEIFGSIGVFSGHLPPDFDTTLLSGDYSSCPVALAGISNTEAFLKSLSSACPLTLSVEDKFMPKNNGTFHFSGERFHGTGDIFISSGNLLQLAFGYLAPEELFCREKINAELNKYFSKQICFTADLY